MKGKWIKAASVLLSIAMVASVLTGCGNSLGEDEISVPEITEKNYAEGDIYFEESPYGIYSGDPELLSKLVNNSYYVYHDEYFYPLASDWRNYEGIELGMQPSPMERRAVFDTSSIVNIPTLFDGDKLFYYSTTGVYDYTILERFKDLGWSIGITKFQETVTGRIYFEPGQDLMSGVESGVILTSEIAPIYDFVANEEKQSDGLFRLDKIGGVPISKKNIEDGILIGLEKGKQYDTEIYSGTEFLYFSLSASVNYLESFETYAISEFTPMQQNSLFEITIPEYLLTGYYDVSGAGFLRLVRGDHYNEQTDYNEQLLFPAYSDDGKTEFTEEEFAEMTEEELADYEMRLKQRAGMYSENEVLNTFVAKDASCFGWVEPEKDEEGRIPDEDDLDFDQFYEASTTRTSIWLPRGKQATISIATNETTGYVYLEFPSGSQRKVPYDRLMGGYVLEINGTDEKCDIVVKGLYKDYKIKLTNAESYKGQDQGISIDIEENKDDKGAASLDEKEPEPEPESEQ